jgi:membrane protein implicated in regulation of membrane protease activity
MKSSVRLAARAHSISLVVILACGLGAAILGLFSHTGTAQGVVFAILAVAVMVALVSAFHIAVSDALQRMEQRQKSSDHDGSA